jgi:hypothetical protein
MIRKYLPCRKVFVVTPAIDFLLLLYPDLRFGIERAPEYVRTDVKSGGHSADERERGNRAKHKGQALLS